MEKAFKYRIYPNREQRILLAKTFGCTRFVYNHYLAKRKDAYEKDRITLSYSACAKDLVSLKKKKTAIFVSILQKKMKLYLRH